ncbi:MAG: glutathione S-transferase family protein [Phaeovulum sp.]|uniref:glutathione S-transferase family protein n=1 Tax=Phaeovulum sp. TaxID=2934796 RepID=UPI002732F4DA|nr:glutathione S-transferase family protein [Phaeovulum sp.]MDP3860897.1 glutathione S-transferase family protein [Phaeovulum sp.]
MPFRLYQMPGWGSAIVEAQLVFYGLPHELVETGDIYEDAAARAALGRINPLAQVPALVLPSGEAMTESAAMTLYLADAAGSEALVPGPGSAERAAFLRWLVFLVANIYPCFTFADVPTRYVAEAGAAKAFRAAVDARAEALWRAVEAAAGAPWFLGERFSALDIYVGVMSHWRPRPAWFAAEAPKLAAISRSVQARPELAAVFARNFG